MCLIKLILLGILGFTTPQEDWIRLRGDHQISFLFPNRGERLKQKSGQLHATIYQTKNAICVFGVVCTPWKEDKSNFSLSEIQEIYQEMRKGSLAIPTALLKEEKPIPAPGMEIREICYTIRKEQGEMTYYKRFIFKDNHIYQFTIGALSEEKEELEAQKNKFFESVQFQT